MGKLSLWCSSLNKEAGKIGKVAFDDNPVRRRTLAAVARKCGNSSVGAIRHRAYSPCLATQPSITFMLFFTRQQRKAWRRRLAERRIQKLADVVTTPTDGVDSRGSVLAIMLTSKPDPQRGEKISTNYAAYLRPWWNTVNRVGLRGVVLHDGLPDDFVASATTKHVKFRQIEPGEWPILHDRHRLFRDYLQSSDDEYVFVTDISDVAFKRDPFALIRADRGHHRLFIGSENKLIGESRCLRKEVTEQFGCLLHAHRQVVNPGIVGGLKHEVIRFLERVINCIAEQKLLLNSDMSIVNRVVHDNYSWSELYTGLPLHSRFKKWEFNSPAAILHK
jgi:hypothetical protein